MIRLSFFTLVALLNILYFQMSCNAQGPSLTEVISGPAKILTWQQIQKFGGMKVGKAYKVKEDVFLPIDCNIAGLRAVTLAPTTMDSSHVVSKINVRMKEKNVYISVASKLASGGNSKESSSCPDCLLGRVPGGTYQVFYDDKVGGFPKVGSFELD